MNGREVFRHAVQKISSVIEETLVTTGYAPDEIDLYVPHQANKRILDGIAKKLGIPRTRSSSRSPSTATPRPRPSPLRSIRRSKNIGSGRVGLVLMEAMGGGFTWGAVLARW